MATVTLLYALVPTDYVTPLTGLPLCSSIYLLYTSVKSVGSQKLLAANDGPRLSRCQGLFTESPFQRWLTL